MSNDSGLQKMRCCFENVRREINQQRVDLAINLLKEIEEEIPPYEGTLECAEFYLLRAEVFSAKKDEIAETFFKEAEAKAARVPNIPAIFLIRLYENFGVFYARSKKLSIARQKFVCAKESSVGQDVDENTTARIQLKITRIDLETDSDPEAENFNTLRRVANKESFPWAEQLMAWHLHIGRVTKPERDVCFARGINKRVDSYFLELLRYVRTSEKDRRFHGEQGSLFP